MPDVNVALASCPCMRKKQLELTLFSDPDRGLCCAAHQAQLAEFLFHSFIVHSGTCGEPSEIVHVGKVAVDMELHCYARENEIFCSCVDTIQGTTISSSLRRLKSEKTGIKVRAPLEEDNSVIRYKSRQNEGGVKKKLVYS